MTLRQKLILGLGLLLAITMVLWVRGVFITTRVANDLREIREHEQGLLADCDSVEEQVVQLEKFFHGDPALADTPEAHAVRAAMDRGIARLDARVAQVGAAGVAIMKAWETFKGGWTQYLAAPEEAGRQQIYRETLSPSGVQIMGALSHLRRDAAERIVTMAAQSQRALETARVRLVVMASLAIAVMVALLLGIGRWILKPLRLIRASVDRIERGEVDGLELPTGRDEMGAVGAALERMARALAEYRRADAAQLERTRQTTQLAIESLPSAVAIMSPEGRIEIANDAARRLFGLKAGMALADIRDKWLADMFVGVLANPRRIDPKGYESAVQVFDASGERFFLPQLFPILDSDGHSVGVTVVLADVTQLRRIDEARSGLISMVSHELKTPLTSIQMCIHLMLDAEADLSGKQRELLEAARQDSERLGQIIESLLDMGRLQAGRARLDLEPVSVADLIADSMGPLEGLVASGALALARELPEGLPPVRADRARIRHAIGNVLSNAAKYTPPGGQITVSAEADEAMVHVRISDTGIGIPAEYLAQIFEKFVRTPGGMESNAEGMGLGLAIAREVIEAHGGQIRVASAEGKGSTFTVSLPRADV